MNGQKWFEQFRVASGLSNKNDKRQANTLLLFRAAAKDIFVNYNITVENQKKYQKGLKKFDNFLLWEENIIFDRARFNKYTGVTMYSHIYIYTLYSNQLVHDMFLYACV